MIWYILLGSYSLLMTVKVLGNLKKIDEKSLLDDMIDDTKSDTLTPLQKIYAKCKIEEIRQGQISFLERSLSTIGAIIFLSMIITTGVQTIRATSATQKVDDLLLKIEKLEEKKEEAEKLVPMVASAIIDIYYKNGVLNQNGISILRYRFKQLDGRPEISNKELNESYRITLVLGEYEKAIELIENNIDLLKKTAFADQLSLAEYYYLTGAENMASLIQSNLKEALPNQPVQLKFRFIALKALLDSNYKVNSRDYIRHVSGILKINFREAQRRIERYITRFQEAAHKFTLIGSPGSDNKN